MTLPTHVTIVEVGPRDGLQNEASTVPTAVKIEWIKRLMAAGLTVIEATSFVSPKWVPQLADAEAVMQALAPYPTVRFPVLVPNLQGLDAALKAGATEIAVFTTSSETFSQKNTHCSVAESLERIAAISKRAKAEQLRIRGYLSCVIACPYEGNTKPEVVRNLATKLLDLGCDEISLGDTIGVGTVATVKQLLEVTLQTVPIEKTAVHFHDTYGQALVNIYAALQYGIATIDAATSGIGGCPYAKGASGNVATEEVVYLLNGLGITTHVDLAKLIEASLYIASQLKKPPQSKVTCALSKKDALP
jgi:hydroxymethylglutaryl-CoA lyase